MLYESNTSGSFTGAGAEEAGRDGDEAPDVEDVDESLSSAAADPGACALPGPSSPEPPGESWISTSDAMSENAKSDS